MLRKVRIKTRLLISFFIVVFFTLTVGLTGYISLTSLGFSAVRVMQNVRILNDIYDHNVAIDNGVYSMVYITDINLTRHVVHTTRAHKEKLQAGLNEYLKIQDQFSDVFTVGDMQSMANLQEIFEEVYIPAVEEIFSMVEQGRREEAHSLAINRFYPIYDTFSYYLNEGFMSNLEQSEIITKRNNESAIINSLLMLVLVLLALIVSVVLALTVTKSIALPLVAVGAAAEKVASGELDIQFEQSQNNDEIAFLSSRLQETMQRLNQVQRLKLEAMEARHEKEKAEAASKSKGDFLANMSHEIRTPMNAIVGMSELLLRRELPQEALNDAKDIKQAASNLISIINDILDFSKIEAGKLEIIPAKYIFSSLVNDTVNIIRMKLTEKPVQFYTNIDSNIPNNLIGDEVRLRQIILNLLSNAAKFTEKGHISLTITGARDQGLGTRDRSSENDTATELHPGSTNNYPQPPAPNPQSLYLRITVSDTGIGIKPEDQAKLFSDFMQVDTKRNRSIEGTGLGLAITKQLCIAMGGEISVTSKYGFGSEFTVLIPQEIDLNVPFSVMGDSDIKQDFDNSAERILNRFIIPHARILVVDDLPTNLKVAEGLLAPYKAAVDTCLEGAKAIEMVMRQSKEQQDYDLIFMDHMMPEMDGIEATALIREWERGEGRNEELGVRALPIIALTANAVSGMREMFLEKGFNDFLSKPIDVYKLEEILERWIMQEKREKVKEKKEEGTEKKLVLLVDGNLANLKLGKNMLEEKYVVATAPSVEKTLKLLENNSPDVILLNAVFRDNSLLSGKFPVIIIPEPFDPATLAASIENYFEGAVK